MNALDRVRQVLAAARRLADPRDPLGEEARVRLPASTGLSPEGVSLALSQSLEVTATDEELGSLAASVSPAPRVVVVLSANVFTAASRAIMLGCASAPIAVVRPSRREPIFSELLVRALREAGAEHVSLTTELRLLPGDHVHVYGRDETIAEIRDAAPAGTCVWGHGAGFGVVALDGHPTGAAGRLAGDVVLFDQRGCLSPRIVLLLGSAEEARAFSADLAGELRNLTTKVPMGVIDAGEDASLATYVDTMTLAGEVETAPSFTVGLDLTPRALVLPPLPRVVHLVRFDEISHAVALLRPLARGITTLGGSGALFQSLAQVLPWARLSSLGDMQRPRLDGPVDRRSPAPRTRL